jgi:NitT/TauT family transport system substrate-binding protein
MQRWIGWLIGGVVVIAAIIVVFGWFVEPRWFVGEAPPVPDQIRIGYMPIAPSLPLFVALESGVYDVPSIGHGVSEAENLSALFEAIPFDTATSLVEALATGSIDVAGSVPIDTVYAGLLIAQNAYRIFGMNVSTPDHPLDVLVVGADSPVEGISDLGGLQVGHMPGTTGLAWLKGITRAIPGLYDSILTTPIVPTLQVEALAGGQVNALYTVEPLGTAAVLFAGGRIVSMGLINQHILAEFVGGAFCLSSEFADTYPEIAQQVVDGFDDAVRQLRGDTAAVRGLLTQYAFVPEIVAQQCELGEVWMLSEIDLASAQELADFYTAQGVLQAEFDVSSALYVGQ